MQWSCAGTRADGWGLKGLSQGADERLMGGGAQGELIGAEVGHTQWSCTGNKADGRGLEV